MTSNARETEAEWLARCAEVAAHADEAAPSQEDLLKSLGSR